MRKAKTLKRGLALFLAALMVFTSPVPALATETGSGDPGISISVPGETEPDSSSNKGEEGEVPDGNSPSESGNTSSSETGSSSSSSDGENTPEEGGDTVPEEGESPETGDGNTSTPETGSGSSSSVPEDPNAVPGLPEVPEVPETQPEQQGEYDVVIDQIFDPITGELTDIPEIMPLISSEDIPGFSGSLRAEWVTGYDYPQDFFITGNFYVYGKWSKWYIGDELAYCLQPLNLHSTEGTVYQTIEFKTLSPRQQNMVARTMLYGGDGSDIEEHICTQILIWEIVLGQVSAVDLSHTGVGGSRNSCYYMVSYYGLDSTYERIKSDVLAGFQIPSFMAKNEIAFNTGEYTYLVPEDGLDLVDENNVLSEFDVAPGGGYAFEIDGNTLHVTIDDPDEAAANDPYQPEVTSPLLEDAYAPSVLAVGNGAEQVKGILVKDPAQALFALSVTEGGTPGGGEEDQTVEVKFKKMDPEHFHPGNYDTAHVDFADKDDDSSAFDNIAGAGIRIEGDGQGAGEYTLPCTVELGEGTFTVTEIMSPGGYYINDGWTATITVTIPEPPEPVPGQPEPEPLPPEVEIEVDYGDYKGDYGEEPEVDPENPEIILYDNRQKGELTLDKIDFETNYINHNDEHIAQGDATFEGAVFGLYAAEDIYLPTTGVLVYSKDELVATATTDANGSFTIPEIEIGNYYLQELVPSTGYVFKNEEMRGQIYEVKNPYQVFPGSDESDPGSVDPDDLNPPATNTLKLEKPAENEDYTGTANEYENTVIKGDLTIYKSLEDDDVSNEDDEDSDPAVKPKGEGIYFGIYLNSKAEAGGNNYFATGNDLEGDGTEDSGGTQGYTWWDLINDLYYSPLPDEYFTQRPLDPNNPPELVNPSVDPDKTEPTDPAQIHLKDLYMVLRTNKDGYASTLDPSTIVWSVARAGQGDGYSNQMEDGGASLGFPQPDPSSSSAPKFNGIEKGGKVNNMQLPYGSYTVVELNPDEGRDPIKFEVFIGRDPANPDEVEPKPEPGEDYPYQDGWNNYEYVFNIENDTLKQTITVVKTDSESGLVVPQSDAVYNIWSWDNDTLNNVTGGAESEHPTFPYYHGIDQKEAVILVPPDLNLNYSSITLPVGGTVDKPTVSLDFDTPASILLNDGRPQIEWTEEEKELIRGDFDQLTIHIEDTSIASLGWDGKITAHKEGTTKFTVILPYEMEPFTGTITVTADGAVGTAQAKRYTCDGHWIEQKINYPSGEIVRDFHTDETGSFTLEEPLVYGDYLLFEKQAPESYTLSLTPYPFTVEKSSVTQPNIYLNISIKQADQVQKGKVVLEKVGNLLTGAEEYTTLLGMTALRPVWELMTIGKGAEFELYAREDIITPDGVKHYSAGEFIEKLTTDITGTTQSRDLYLGKYFLRESKAPNGFLVSEEEYDFELTYEGQCVTVYPEFLTLENARQNVIFKILKQFQTTDGKLVPANDVYFGIYAAEDIYLSPAVSPDDVPDGNTGVDGEDDPAAVTSLMTTIDKGSLLVGETATLSIDTAPEGADDAVNVFGYDASIISIEPAGEHEYTITALATGETTVKVATMNGLRTESRIEVVTPEDYTESSPVIGIDEFDTAQGMIVHNTLIHLTPLETQQISVELLPEGVPDDITYLVSNTTVGTINGQAVTLDPSCITISSDGMITAQHEGTAKFVVETSTGLSVSGYVVVTTDKDPDDDMSVLPGTAQYPPKQVTLERSNVYIIASSDAEKSQADLELSFLSAGCNEEVTVTVANQGIATYDPIYKVFRAVAVGDTTFTVETVNGLIVEGTITVVPEAENPADQPAFPAAVPVSSEVVKPTDSRVIIPKDSLLEVVRIVDGEGRSSLELPLGKFYAKELQAPEGYIIDDSIYEFEFKYNPAGETEVIITANGGRPIVNYPDTPEKPPEPPDKPDKEYGKLILEYDSQGMWEKDNPITGVDEEEAPETLTHEFIYESDTPEGDYQVPQSMEQNGSSYKLMDVTYQIYDESHKIEKTVQIPAGEEIPDTITVEEDGKEVTLYLVSSEAGELTEQVVAVTGEIDFGYTAAQPAAPATKQVSYTDTLTGERKTATAYLTSIEMVEDYHWRDDVVVDATFYGGSDVDGFRLGIGNTIVPYRSSKPALDGYEDDYLEYLNLSESQYRLTGAEWTGEWTKDERGNEIRTAEFTGERYVGRWVAHYSTNVNTSTQDDVTAVYSNNEEDSYTIKAVAIYEKVFSPIIVAIIATAVTSIFITALVIAIILYIIAKRRKQKDAQIS